MASWALRAGLLALLAAGGPSPVQAAFDLSVSADPTPFGVAETRTVGVSAVADCSSILARAAGGAQPFQDVAAPVQLTASGGFLLVGPPTLDFPLAPCRAGSATASAQAHYQLAAGRSAVAFVPYAMRVDAALPPLSGPAQQLDPSADSEGFTASVAPALVGEVTVPDRVQACRCAEATFHVRVANHGNARTTYTFAPGDVPAGWTVGLPPPLTLDPPLAGGTTSGEVAVTVRAPPGRWSSVSLTVLAEPRAAEDPEAWAAPLPAHLLLSNADARSRVQDAPGPGPALPLLALAAAGAVLSRRRA
jgi:hypothetical protein